MIQMNVLGRARGFAFNPAKEFAKAKEDSLRDAFTYYVLLLAILAGALAVVVTVAVAVSGMSPLSKFAPLLGVGAFVGIIAVGILLALYLAVWLHIWVYLFGGRKGLKQTTKAITYGSTPCLLLWWAPGANVIIAPVLSLLAVISGVSELHRLSSGAAILAVILAILVPVIALGAVAAVALPLVLG